MQYIDFVRENLNYHQSENHYSLEIPRETVGDGDIKVKKKNEEGMYEDAEVQINEYDDKIVILSTIPVDLRVEF